LVEAVSVSLDWSAEVSFLLDFADINDHPDNGRNKKYDHSGQQISRPFVSRLFVSHS